MKITKETRNKIGLMVLGLTVFPAIVYGLKALFSDSSETLSGYYAYFYRSLLDMGTDGMIVWCIACGPYMVYEIFLIVRGRSLSAGQPET